jgi:hypothetical protein
MLRSKNRKRRRLDAARPPVEAAGVGEPGTLGPDDPIRCDTLHATIPARCCVQRQLVSARQRTADTWRGQGSAFPSCTIHCAQGCAVRAALGPDDTPGWRGQGSGGRCLKEQRDVFKQMSARRRLLVVGLLDAAPRILDVDPDPTPEPDDDGAPRSVPECTPATAP